MTDTVEMGHDQATHDTSSSPISTLPHEKNFPRPQKTINRALKMHTRLPWTIYTIGTLLHPVPTTISLQTAMPRPENATEDTQQTRPKIS